MRNQAAQEMRHVMERAEQVVEPVETVSGPTARPVPHEQPLTLGGVSADRSTLLLHDDDGGSYTLPVTSSLRAALRGDPPRTGRPGKTETTTMDSALRPKDIQARIRSGESAESVAEAARTTVDKIMAFVGPVLAERQHVAERAQRSHLRRSAGESAAGGRTLGDAVETHLRSLHVDPEVVEWDSWRRDDGRWVLTAGYALPTRTGTGHFVYDVPGNYVVLDDSDARWLVGEGVPAPAPSRDDLQSVRERRLTSVGQDELPLGDDAIELVTEQSPEPAVEDTPGGEAVEGFLDDSPASDDPALREEAVEAGAAESEPDEQPARRTVQKKKGRASVPSWDEIMFGGPSSD